jgi:palmitoyltransferase
MPRTARSFDLKDALEHSISQNDGFDIKAFRRRQLEDLKRFNQNESSIRKRQVFHKRYETVSNGHALEPASKSELSGDEEGEEAWRNSEGDRLADFGVDEETEFYDEEDIPLAELLKRRRGLKAAETKLSD